MKFEEKLKAMGYSLESRGKQNSRPFEGGIQTGNLIFVSGHAARVDGELICKGTVGKDVTVEEAQKAAIAAFLNCLRAVKEVVGDLDSISKVVNIKGYIVSSPDFTDQPKVMNAVSELVNSVFGETGKHSRIAVGTVSLPGGTSVEVEMIVEVK